MSDIAVAPDDCARIEISPYMFEPHKGRGEYAILHVRAGQPTTNRVVPPAGEAYAFNSTTRPLRVEISVSPSGRSTRLWVNGVEIDWEDIKP